MRKGVSESSVFFLMKKIYMKLAHHAEQAQHFQLQVVAFITDASIIPHDTPREQRSRLLRVDRKTRPIEQIRSLSTYLCNKHVSLLHHCMPYPIHHISIHHGHPRR